VLAGVEWSARYAWKLVSMEWKLVSARGGRGTRIRGGNRCLWEETGVSTGWSSAS